MNINNQATMAPNTDMLRADEYSYRVPTPPRIVVPPPTASINMAPEFHLQSIAQTGPLASINYQLMAHNSLLDWSYERRREAQQVVPFLYLGPMKAAKDRDFLRTAGITLFLGVRQRHTFESKIMDAVLNLADELNIERHTIDVSDSRELVSAFPRATEIITSHMERLDQAAKVLVFCESGNERSAAVVAACLMEVLYNVDYIKAMQIVQAQRFCVNFDDNAKRILQSYWDILRARRDVGTITSSTAKRSHEPDMDDNEGMDVDQVETDAARFENRRFTPFVNM